jgi:hypothetical protein
MDLPTRTSLSTEEIEKRLAELRIHLKTAIGTDRALTLARGILLRRALDRKTKNQPSLGIVEAPFRG